MTNEKKFSEILFWVFCLVVFSKIIWYDVRVYWPSADRREIMTSFYAGWIAAQALVYLPILFQLLRQLRPAVFVFIAAVAPYLLLGALEGRINLFLIGDIARYGASVGFLLFSLWAVKNVPVRTMLTAIVTTMVAYFVLRIGLHLFLAEGGRMRFGRDWEVLLSTILIASAAMARGVRFGLLLVAIALIVLVTAFGLTRSLMFGIAIGAVSVIGLSLLDSRFSLRRNAHILAAAGVAVVAVAIPMTTSIPLLDRLNVSRVITDTDRRLIREEPRSAGKDVERLTTHSTTNGARQNATRPEDRNSRHASSGDTPNGKSTRRETSRSDAALANWEADIAKGDHSMDSRISESIFFLQAMRHSTKTLLLGPGGGDYVTVDTPNTERKVRGAHNTYVTLLYRHGVIFGGVLIYFLVFFGLPTNFMQLRTTDDPVWQVLLTALISYRVSAAALALLHQGLMDDPLVFLSIAIALAGPAAPSILEIFKGRKHPERAVASGNI